MNSPSTNEFTYKSKNVLVQKFPSKKLKKSSSETNLINVNNQSHQRIKDYEIIKELGRGAYGTVHLAKKDSDGKTYALKVLDKMFLQRNSKSEEALIERIILSICNHPGIIKINATFQTKNKLFFVLEYAPNRDLDFIMRKFGTLPNELAVCYASEIINVLEYLHNKVNISHNDLKPSNIMLDENYHLKLIDFSTAKIEGKKFDSKVKKFVECKNYIDKDIVGTAEYCSPEMINQCISNYKTNDIWAFGIILYYFYHGKTPFRGSNDFQTFDRIKKGKYELNQLIPEDAQDLISHILVIDTKKRYTIDDIKHHPYFKDVDWEHLLEKKVPIPIDLLTKFTMKLSSGDSNTDFWVNFCNDFNGLVQPEYKIEKLSDYLIVDDFYYGKENDQNSNLVLSNKKERLLVYEGIMIKVGLINNSIKVKLFSDKMLECWNIKKKNIDKVLKLTKNITVSIENELYLKMNFGKSILTLKTTKLEAVKWYNFINKVIYA